MRTTLAALAGASAALAAYTPDSYSDNSPPAYGSDESSSASSSSTYVASTSSTMGSPATGTPDFPSCWSSCFKDAGVKSPEETCGNSDLTSCIEDSCSSEEADKYKSWLAEECGSESTSSNVVGPTGSMSVSHGPSGYPSSSSLSGYPHGPSSYPVGGPSSYPAGGPSSYPMGGPSSYPVGPSGYVPSSSGSAGGYGNCTTTYSSVCTETETLIYRSTTEYVPTTITHIFTTNLPSGSCSSVPYPITSSSSTPYSPVTTSGVPGGPGGYPSGGAGGYPSGGAGGYPDGPHTTVTDVETIYTTVCPYTETHESDGQTVTKVYQTTSEVTETYQTTIVVTPTSPADSTPTEGSGVPANLPECWGVCFTKNGATSQEAACENSAVSQCIKDTCTADESSQFDAWVANSCGAGSGSGEGSGSGSDDGSDDGSDGGDSGLPTEPAGGNGVPTEYTSISPVTKPFTYGDWTSYYTDFETVTLTSYVTQTEGGSYPTGAYTSGSPTEGSPDGGNGGNGGYETTKTQVYETPITTAYTTVCTATDSDGLTTSTITTTSTIQLTFTVTTTDYPTASSTDGSPSAKTPPSQTTTTMRKTHYQSPLAPSPAPSPASPAWASTHSLVQQEDPAMLRPVCVPSWAPHSQIRLYP